jgi:hypothetical protein
MLSGCGLAAVEAISADAVAATAEGTMVAEAGGGAEMAALRGGVGAGAAEGSAASEAGTLSQGVPVSRLLVSDPLLDVAQSGGVLEEALSRLTAGGTRTAVLGVDSSGMIRAGMEPLAQFRGTQVIYNNEVVGELSDHILYDMRTGSAPKAVAELDGVVPGRLLRGGGGFILPSADVFVEVIQVENGWYLIRLPGQAATWVPAELVALALLGTDVGGCSDESGSLVLRSGETIPFQRCQYDGAVYRLELSTGTLWIDGSRVRKIIPGTLTANAVAPALTLKGGYAFFGRADDLGDVYRVTTPSGRVLLIDRRRVEQTAAPEIASSSRLEKNASNA